MKNNQISNRAEVIDIILRNKISATMSVTNQMYQIGDNEASITVQCDKNGNVLSAFCKCGPKLLVFTDPEDAQFVSNACKQCFAAQKREEQKIKSFNRKFR